MTSSDILPQFFKYVPTVLQNKVQMHWGTWLKACETAGHSIQPLVDPALLGKVWACSDFIATTSCRKPDLWFQLIDAELLDRSIELTDYRAELESLLVSVPGSNDFALMQTLRLFRQKHMLRIAWRDIAGQASTTETLRNLTDLAETCVDTTLEFLYQDQCQLLGTPCDAEGEEMRMVVLGMGKLGGHELNFSSDIDLIFAFPEEGETRGGRSLANSQFFIRLGQRFIKVLNDTTADGFVFRVDMRLRPYGDSGPLVMSFAGMEQYYQTQGRDWERYAMIKARVIGGDREAGDELMTMLRPFVYRRYLDFGAFESIREMKAMIDKEIRRKGNINNIKLGKGGIREIEFIGQTYQLIRGGGEPDLQIRSIIQVLALLADKGYMSHQETEALAESYDFLRRLENRLQMYADGQTHNLPEDTLIQHSMVLAMGYENWESLVEATDFHRQRVHACFSQVFALSKEDDDSNMFEALWQGDLDESEVVELLQQQDCTDCMDVAHQLKVFKESGMIRSMTDTARQRLDNLMPLLLRELVAMEHAGQVLQRVLNLLQAIVRRSVYLSLLVEYPVALQQLIKLCGASPWIASLLTRYPILLDELLDPRVLYEIPTQKHLQAELDAMMSTAVDDEEREMEILRKFKQAQVLRVAAMDLSGTLQVFDVSDQLTAIAEVLLQKAYELAWQHMVKRHGQPMCDVDGVSIEPEMAVIAYGKLGGHELGYGSDLDIVFLHDSRGENQYTNGDRCIDNSSFFARLAQRMVHILATQTANGRLYEIDTRLRPDGAAGMLVSSLESFEYYQQEKSWTWEHQALIRARMVIGGTHLAEEFDRIRRSVITRQREPEQLKQDVIEMRQKMRDALGSKKADAFHLKLDEGGIVDIEFLTQYCVLATAVDHPQLLDETATRRLLSLLQKTGCVSDAQVRILSDAYQQYRACSHQRALQEQSSTMDGEAFQSLRSEIIQIWHNVLDVESGADV